MRVFEMGLVLINLLSLFLCFKRQRRGIWFGAAAINLLVLCMHGALEGFRYQMVFSYVFVILFSLCALLKIKTPKLLKGGIIVLSILTLMLTSVLSYALPVFSLSKLTGDHAVGIQYFHLTDEKRNDPFLSQGEKKRELMVKVYYPAESDTSKPYDLYFHNSSELTKELAAFYNMPSFFFEHLRLVKTHSQEGLKLSTQEQSYPVVLFSHGAGTSMEVETSQCEDLASRGYIVAAIDHTYVSAATMFPDKVISHKEATTDFDTSEPAEVITQIMAEDVKFVIDQLAEMNKSKTDTLFRDRLNMEKIGVIGHSVGGAVAYNLAVNDDRIKAAINLDGVVYVTPKEDLSHMAPFLMLANDQYHVQSIQQRTPLIKKLEDMPAVDREITLSIYGGQEAYEGLYQRAQQNVRGLAKVLEASGNLYTIEGSDHMKFTDIGLFIGSSQLRELMGIKGKTKPTRCLEITEAVTGAFFERYLKEDTNATPDSLFEKYPELKRMILK